MQGREGVKHMRKEGDNAWMVVLIEDLAVDLGTTFGGGEVNTTKRDKALHQRQPDDTATFSIATWRQV